MRGQGPPHGSPQLGPLHHPRSASDDQVRLADGLGVEADAEYEGKK